MRYKVMGANRETGARVTMEFDANNRALAERKAVQAGMEVLHVETVSDENQEQEHPHRTNHRGEHQEPSTLSTRIILFLVLAAVIVGVFVFWATVRGEFEI